MTDNELIERLFREARQMEVADNGFSDRVMERLNADAVVQQTALRRERLFSRLWTLGCVAIAAVLFVVLGGWNIIVYGLLMLLNTPPTHQQMLVFVVSVGVIGLLALNEVISRERYSVI
jgi:hypothetical protein